MKINEDYNITKNGVIRRNPNVMPYDTILSINRAWEDIKNNRVIEIKDE